MSGSAKLRWSRKTTLRVSSLAVFAVAWETFGRLDTSLLLPPLSSVMTALMTMLLDGTLVAALGVSLQGWVVGFGISAVAGVWLGLFMARSSLVERVANPYLDALLAAPTIAFIPLFVVWFGLGLTARVSVIFCYAFTLVTVNSFAGIRGVDAGLIDMGRSFGLTGRRLFWKIILPAALPLIVAGLRLGAARAFVGMVAADTVLVLVGIGELIAFYNTTFRFPQMYAAILAVVLLAVAMVELLAYLQRRMFRWA
jgi:ABC-type nitrate/sulfonate/bicarbonate transport system permease component